MLVVFKCQFFRESGHCETGNIPQIEEKNEHAVILEPSSMPLPTSMKKGGAKGFKLGVKDGFSQSE